MDCETCEEHLSHVLKAGRPRKLLDAIRQGASSRKAGGEAVEDGAITALPPEGLSVVCHVCPNTGPASFARAFFQAPPPGVVLCANRLKSREKVEEAVVHELVHAYDFLVSGVKLQECQALAYSEVRAAHAAECSEKWKSFPCSHFKKNCIRNVATRSTEGVFPVEAAACVDAVFDAAYKDRGPDNIVSGKKRRDADT